MNTAKILVGNNIDRLREMEDGSVRTVVTSPPYWGLRDYGTGTWVGGDSDCTHRRESKKSDTTITGHKNFTEMLGVADAIYKTSCQRCGAVRQDDQLGLEETVAEYVQKLVELFREVRRVLADDGTIWINLGDTYLPSKDLAGVPWRVAMGLQDDGWCLRQDIIWSKPNPMPESVKDRCTKSHEYIFMLTKQSKYFFDHEAIREPIADSSRERLEQNIDEQRGSVRAHAGDKTNGTMKAVGGDDGLRSKRSVWNVGVASFKEAHFAVYPPALIEPCILAGSEHGDTVLDPFSGSGTTGVVALLNQRNYVGLELNSKYADISEYRLTESLGLLAEIIVSRT